MVKSEIKPIWWLPTFGFFLFLALEFWMFASPNPIFEDPGVGRHLRTAEFILETGVVPRVDPLSFTKGGQTWFDFEWAFETTIGELYRLGGLALVCAFCYGLFATTLLSVYRTLLHSGFSVSVVLLYSCVAFLTLHMHFSVRPLLFTYLFMALVVEVWKRRAHPLKRDWIILPIVFVAWANLHAGWLAAFLFLGISMSGRLVDRITGRVNSEEAPLIPWIGLTILCALATYFNPWGWALHHHVVLLATTYKSFALWDEFLAPNFSTPTMSAIAILFIVFTVFLARTCRNAPGWRWEALIPILFFTYEGLLATPVYPLLLLPGALFILFVLFRTRPCADLPRWRWETLLPVLFFLFEGLKTQRHVLLLVIVAAVPVARDLQSLIRIRGLPFIQGRLAEFQAQQRLAGGDAWLSLIAIIIFAVLFVRTPIGRDIQVGKSVTPQLMSFLRDHPDRFQRPLTTTWNAGPLLWNMRPDFRVSMDDRGDFYGDPYVFAFVDMVNGASNSKEKAGWRETFDQGNYDSAILDPYLELNKRLHDQPNWHEVYRDEHAVVYWKR